MVAHVTHKLKCRPPYFEAVKDGRKNFEARLNDRDYHVGDHLHLCEWTEFTGYTGRECFRTVTYVMYGGEYGVADGNCVLSFPPQETATYYVAAAGTLADPEESRDVVGDVALAEDEVRQSGSPLLVRYVIQTQQTPGPVYWAGTKKGATYDITKACHFTYQHSAVEIIEKFTGGQVVEYHPQEAANK